MAALGGLLQPSRYLISRPPALTFITSACRSPQGHAKYHQIFMILITAPGGGINKSAPNGSINDSVHLIND